MPDTHDDQLEGDLNFKLELEVQYEYARLWMLLRVGVSRDHGPIKSLQVCGNDRIGLPSALVRPVTRLTPGRHHC